MAVIVPSQADFGPNLKYWRQHHKKSQMDLALDAEISTRHLSFIETGRSNPSRELVIKLAAILKLPYRHTNTLLKSAGFSPIYQKETLDSPKMAMVKEALERLMENHDPYPAMIVDSSYKVLMANEGFARFVSYFAGEQALLKYDNALTMMFAEDGLKPYIQDFEMIAQFVLMRIREEVIASQNPELMSIYKQHAENIPLGNIQNSTMDHTIPLVTLTLCKDDVTASFFTTIATLGTPLDLTTQELRIEMLFPADERSKDFMIGLKK